MEQLRSGSRRFMIELRREHKSDVSLIVSQQLGAVVSDKCNGIAQQQLFRRTTRNLECDKYYMLFAHNTGSNICGAVIDSDGATPLAAASVCQPKDEGIL